MRLLSLSAAAAAVIGLTPAAAQDGAQDWIVRDFVNAPPFMAATSEWPFIGGVILATPTQADYRVGLVCYDDQLTLMDSSRRTDEAGAEGPVTVTVGAISLELRYEVRHAQSARRIALPRTRAVQALREALPATETLTLRYADGHAVVQDLAGYGAVEPVIRVACNATPQSEEDGLTTWRFEDYFSNPSDDPDATNDENFPYVNGQLLATYDSGQASLALLCEGPRMTIVDHRGAPEAEGTATLSVADTELTGSYVVWELSGDTHISLDEPTTQILLGGLQTEEDSGGYLWIRYGDTGAESFTSLHGFTAASRLALGACL